MPTRAPQQVLASSINDPSPEDLARLVRLKDDSPELTTILRRVHFGELPTIIHPESERIRSLLLVNTTEQFRRSPSDSHESMVCGLRSRHRVARTAAVGADESASRLGGRLRLVSACGEGNREQRTPGCIGHVPDDIDHELDVAGSADESRTASWSAVLAPWGTAENPINGQKNMWQSMVMAVAARDSDRAKAFAQAEQTQLPAGRYLVKIYINRADKTKNDRDYELGKGEFFGQVEIDGEWQTGYQPPKIIQASRSR